MTIAIIGLGYVGLPLCLQCARSGVRVLGLDVDAKKVSALNAGGESTNSVQASATPQAPPNLNISQTGTNFMFSWPLASTGFTLQSRTNLALGNWVDVTSPVPQVVGSNWLVTLPRPVDNSSVFYRLAK